MWFCVSYIPKHAYPISQCNGFETQSFELLLRKNKEINDKTEASS